MIVAGRKARPDGIWEAKCAAAGVAIPGKKKEKRIMMPILIAFAFAFALSGLVYLKGREAVEGGGKAGALACAMMAIGALAMLAILVSAVAPELQNRLASLSQML